MLIKSTIEKFFVIELVGYIQVRSYMLKDTGFRMENHPGLKDLSRKYNIENDLASVEGKVGILAKQAFEIDLTSV